MSVVPCLVRIPSFFLSVALFIAVSTVFPMRSFVSVGILATGLVGALLWCLVSNIAPRRFYGLGAFSFVRRFTF